MKRLIVTVMLLLLVAPSVQALIITPDFVFTLRDEQPTDGMPDRSSSVDLPEGFTGFVTNDLFVDETFIEFAVGSESVASATFSLGMFILDTDGIDKTFDISSYDNGLGTVQLNLFGTGDYLTTAGVTGTSTLNIINLDITTIYNSAVVASDDFLGFRLHNAVQIDRGDPQVFYNDSSLSLSEVPVPAAVWLFGTALIGLVGFSKRRKAA